MSISGLDFSIARLGECRIPSPMSHVHFTRDDERVLYHDRFEEMKAWIDKRTDPPSFETAGPREKIFFDPSKLACGIVTCGGLCPALKDVIRAIVMSLHHHYGVRTIYGFQYGYEGLAPNFGHEPIMLTPQAVSQINATGGTKNRYAHL